METAVAEFTERRSGLERRSDGDRRGRAVSETRGEEVEKKHNKPLEVAGSVAAAALGLYVYQATGLYSAADSNVVGIGLGALIASWFVLNFRVGLHQK